MRGSKLQKTILDYITAIGGHSINVEAASRNGEADIVACVLGLYINIEVKGDNDTVKRLQDAKRRRVTKAGGISFIAWSLEDVKKELTTDKLRAHYNQLRF